MRNVPPQEELVGKQSQQLAIAIPAHIEIEVIKVRMTPAGEMDSANAARYLNRSTGTLAHWRVTGQGPEYEVREGRIIYTQHNLDRYRVRAAKAGKVLPAAE
jgi:hypothetical protein